MKSGLNFDTGGRLQLFHIRDIGTQVFGVSVEQECRPRNQSLKLTRARYVASDIMRVVRCHKRNSVGESPFSFLCILDVTNPWGRKQNPVL